ncbi:NAD(P)-dependent dehydrogenase (short-subunit alcohol dehydrogenase family) [Jezberella montanilacus]|uniref:NAD(P)-dependent dehydrogenase (Short-subunit alcohol dehydrogenase family) n=1 Tax=Jezberella montanilacus TaxID=323426 RepID=A0A2T0XED2_9BURK|nr:SDR family NAD(P)-dependent oxidoreductase [Jezberella montanilacus]PRY97271.1 NAD(P)-dependent dehydrogenase (short-subunit alcohol dehydrogenase family) [Jezberella montanilacus]|eukprot:gene3972-4022_t
MNHSGRLEGKVAIIVGAGQEPGETIGNGRAVSERFAEEGATLLLVDIGQDRADATFHAVKKYGGVASTMTADITNEEDCKRIAATCLERYGRIDILHNNVGKSEGDRKTVDLDVKAWDDIMGLNLRGMFMTCKHVLPAMIKQKAGSIINISSTSSLAARPTLTYKTSKGAINTMTQHIAMENAAFGIRANAILPGFMDTPMAIERRARETGVTREEIRAARDKLVPMGYMGTAWDVANAAVFFASDESKYVTGVLMPVDGGLLIKRG